jgi:hypothetical protein
MGACGLNAKIGFEVTLDSPIFMIRGVTPLAGHDGLVDLETPALRAGSCGLAMPVPNGLG